VTVNELGPLPAAIISSVWMVAGIAFAMYSVYTGRSKVDLGVILLITFGPVAWTMHWTCVWYQGRHPGVDFFNDTAYRVRLEIAMVVLGIVPWGVLLTWFTYFHS
jgi:hypothetical protein